MNIVNGALQRVFEIKKIKLAAEKKDPKENVIHAISSAQLPRICYKKGCVCQ